MIMVPRLMIMAADVVVITIKRNSQVKQQRPAVTLRASARDEAIGTTPLF